MILENNVVFLFLIWFHSRLPLSVHLPASSFQSAGHRGGGRRPGAAHVRQLPAGRRLVEEKVPLGLSQGRSS